jgi:phosphohistidine phosphatase
MARHLASTGAEPALVLCSSSRRTLETLERIGPALGPQAEVLVEDELYAASSGRLLARLRLVPDDVPSVLLIGHNPGLEDLAASLAGRGEALDRLQAKFPTGALATLELPGAWSALQPGSGELVDYVVPRELA